MHEDDIKRAEEIVRQLNCLSCNEGEIGAEIAAAHPTLQQSFMRAAVGFLQAVAKKDYVDARNERTRDLARRMLTGLEDTDLYLPLI